MKKDSVTYVLLEILWMFGQQRVCRILFPLNKKKHSSERYLLGVYKTKTFWLSKVPDFKINFFFRNSASFWLFLLSYRNILLKNFCGLHLTEIFIHFSISDMVEFSIACCPDCHSFKCWFTFDLFAHRLLLLLLPRDWKSQWGCHKTTYIHNAN